MNVNLNDKNNVRSKLNELLRTEVNFKGIRIPLNKLAKITHPLIGRISPIVEDATGYSVNNLLSELNSVSSEQNSQRKYARNSEDVSLYDKYRNL